MRRREIVAAVKSVLDAIDRSGLREIAAFRRERPDKAIEASDLIRAFRSYSHTAASFGPTENIIVKIMNLEFLDDPLVWTRSISDTPDVLRELGMRLRYAGPQLEQFIELLETEADRIAEQPSRSTVERISETAILSTIVIEEEGHYSSPERLIKVLRSVSTLYEVVAKLKEVRPSTLSVIGCDSGSDKSFDFLGLASVVNGVKDILIAVWDRVVFYRERQIEARLELISRSLPVMEQISVMEEQKVIGPEQAEILRRRVTEGVTLFVEGGVLIPEIHQRSSYSPRQLLAPEPKLLVAANAPDNQATKETDLQRDTNLTPEEEQTLRRLLNKVKGEEDLRAGRLPEKEAELEEGKSS